jgi:cytochrome bd ubiquinol oxidase subunit II
MILHELISLDVLRVIWWGLLGVLLIGFALTDGFDMGVGALLPFVGKTDTERRVVINTIGPVWEGNQVWFILGGGAIFAAWPPLYAMSFSGFYLAMFLVLAALILRPVGFKYRSKRESTAWRNGWDWALFVGGFVPALLFGVAVGNVLQGAPFHLTDDLLPVYEGSPFGKLFGLLNPFALLAGVVSAAMIIMHGAAWLGLKAEDPIAGRARRIGIWAAGVAFLGYALAGVWLAFGIDGYAFAGDVAVNGPSNPLFSEVNKGGSWLAAYGERPWIAIAPVFGFVGMAMAALGLKSRRDLGTLLWSKLAIFGVISSVGLTMFPFILPSTTDPRSSLTVWDASSSHLTLFVMLVVTVIFMPLILLYTAWVYKVLWGKVTEDDVNADSGAMY